MRSRGHAASRAEVFPLLSLLDRTSIARIPSDDFPTTTGTVCTMMSCVLLFTTMTRLRMHAAYGCPALAGVFICMAWALDTSRAACMPAAPVVMKRSRTRVAGVSAVTGYCSVRPAHVWMKCTVPGAGRRVVRRLRARRSLDAAEIYRAALVAGWPWPPAGSRTRRADADEL